MVEYLEHCPVPLHLYAAARKIFQIQRFNTQISFNDADAYLPCNGNFNLCKLMYKHSLSIKRSSTVMSVEITTS
jgi:hypothetical protein